MNRQSVGTGVFRKSFKAFTLVELLVVVAIIALLVSILLPTLGKAKEQTRMVVCMTNLKGLSLAFTYYSNESSGWFPQAAGYGGTIGMRSWDIVIQPLYDNFGLLGCPSDNAERPWSRSWGKYPECDAITVEYGRYNRSYAMNCELAGMGASEYGAALSPPYGGNSNFPFPGYVHHTSDVELPDGTVLLAEMWESFYHLGDSGYVQKWMPNQYSAYWGCGITYDRYGRQATFYHRDKTIANFLFCDGHLEKLPEDDPYISSEKGYFYWLLEK